MRDWILTGLLVIFWTALTLLAGCLLALIGWHVRAAVAGIREWRAQRAMAREALAWADLTLPTALEHWPTYEISDEDLVTAPDRDDEWAEELHRINVAVNHKHHVWSVFQEQLVPVSEVTHYEVEGVIRQLRVPDWLPAYRLAA